MSHQKFNLRFALIVCLILLAAASRLIPHMPNFSPLAAIGLFGAAYFQKKWQVFLLPIAATFLSDLFINNVTYGAYNSSFVWFYSGFYWQYGSYLIITLVSFFIFKKVNTQRVLGGALAASAIFFFISNFGSWLGNPTYAQNFTGLLTCYAAGVPFLKGTLLGNLCYSSVLFGLFVLAQKRFTALRLVKA
jgi:hypothetical protein